MKNVCLWPLNYNIPSPVSTPYRTITQKRPLFVKQNCKLQKLQTAKKKKDMTKKLKTQRLTEYMLPVSAHTVQCNKNYTTRSRAL